MPQNLRDLLRKAWREADKADVVDRHHYRQVQDVQQLAEVQKAVPKLPGRAANPPRPG